MHLTLGNNLLVSCFFFSLWYIRVNFDYPISYELKICIIFPNNLNILLSSGRVVQMLFPSSGHSTVSKIDS